ncbi:MAG: hypothetical protein ACW976_06170 [Candidatus Ranarchaeia archaeon]|jgi:hypothetical protein
MTGIDLETMLQEIHSLKQESKGLERRNLQTLERLTEKLLIRQNPRHKQKRNPYWFFGIGSFFVFMGFLGFFEAFSQGLFTGGLVWLSGALIPGFWCVWKFLKT